MKYSKIILVFAGYTARTTIEGPCEYRLDNGFFVVSGEGGDFGFSLDDIKEFKCFK